MGGRAISIRALFALVVVAAFAMAAAAACGDPEVITVTETVEVPGETVFVTETVEVPGETVIVTETVEVPGETVIVTETVEVPGETVIVTETVEVPGETIIVTEIVEVPVMAAPAPIETQHPAIQQVLDDLGITVGVPGPADGPASYGGSITARGFESSSFDIHMFPQGQLQMALSFSHQGLLRWDQGPGKSPTTFTPVPGLAESWEVTDGGRTYMFKLRQGVKWHDISPVDGREVTAADFQFTFDRINRIDQAGVQRELLNKVTYHSTPDDSTVVFGLDQPVAAFLQFMANPTLVVLPPEVEAACEDYSLPECSAIGTGPFMFSSHTPGVSTTFERNPTFWERPFPYIDELIYLYFGDERSEDAAFRTGKLDLLGVETCGISGERFKNLNSSNPEMLYPSFVDTFNRRALFMKTDREPFDDVNVRRAVSMSIDRTGWVNSVLGNYGIPFGGYLHPGNDYWLPDEDYGAAAQYLQYNPEESVRLLAEAGFGPGDIKLTLEATNSAGERPTSEAELIAGALNEIGIDTTLRLVDIDTFVPVFIDGDYEKLAYFFMGFGALPEDWLVIPFHSELRGKTHLGIDDPKLDALLDGISTSLDSDERIRLAQEASIYIADQAYAIAGPYWIYFYAQNPRVMNYTFHDSFHLGYAMSQAWIEE